MNPRRPGRSLGRSSGAAFAPLILVLAAVGCGSPEPAEPSRVTVAVAANFLEAHEALARRFTERTGIEILTSAGSTGQLFAQAMNGAPFDVFLAADSARPRRLEEEGWAVRGTRFVYANGRLALYGPALDSVRSDGSDLASEAVRNIAIANPRTAPYGAAAMEVIARLAPGGVDARLVRGESIGQAYQFVESGAAELGFVALSQVADAPPGSYWTVPDHLHAPIVQEAVLLERAETSDAARAYLDFLRGDEARELIGSFGYGSGPAAGP